MANNAQPLVKPETTLDPIEAAQIAASVAFTVPEGSLLDRLAIVKTIKADIAALESDGSETVSAALALATRVAGMKDQAVIAFAATLESVPEKVLQAAFHKEYGGKVNSAGKVSPTTPTGDGEAFLKAAKAYRDVLGYIQHGTIPESWARGEGTRAAIAEMLDASEKLDLAARVSEMSKIGVSDVVTRFFGEYRAKAAPLWANIEKLENLAVDIQLNADYLTDAENSALRAAYETVIAAYRGLTK